eukprot:comp61583_c0_seq1/m.47899 comp61583_c0_seq1/g.47899  ORF comp61583_c0_seq1/g.47899 comp61583_c0_seq1/m.47899 type:complete len:201 (-) comp61583_c0_seq1:425-1027(-)
MHFRFCGGLDCPDWVLAETALLSKLATSKARRLCELVADNISGTEIDYEKAGVLTSDAKFAVSDVKAAIAALTFILTSAIKYGVSGDELTNELLQLGLPKDHAAGVSKVFVDRQEAMKAALRAKVLTLPRVEGTEWKVSYVLASSELKRVCQPIVQLRLHVDRPRGREPVTVDVTADKFKVLLHELKQAEGMMAQLEENL